MATAVLSQSNVRGVKAGVSTEDLAEDIARRTLLQSLNVRPILDGEGVETGMFEVPASGRRYRALQLLVKQKRLAKTAPVPCVVRDPSVDISAEVGSDRKQSSRRDDSVAAQTLPRHVSEHGIRRLPRSVRVAGLFLDPAGGPQG